MNAGGSAADDGGGRRGGRAAKGQGAQPERCRSACAPASAAAPAGRQAQEGRALPGSRPPRQPQGCQARNGQPGAAEARGGGDRPEGGAVAAGVDCGGRGGIDPNMTPKSGARRWKSGWQRCRPRSASNSRRCAPRAVLREAVAAAKASVAVARAPAEATTRAADAAERRPAERAERAESRPRGRTRPLQRIGRDNPAGSRQHASGATTIDALFGPLPQVESRGRAWLYIDKKLKPINLRLGVSDGTFTEILSGEVQQGQEVVTAMVTGLEPKTGTPTGTTPTIR